MPKILRSAAMAMLVCSTLASRSTGFAQSPAPPALDRPSMMAERIVDGTLPAALSAEELDAHLASASAEFGIGEAIAEVLPAEVRATAIDSFTEQRAEWNRLGRPMLVEVVRRDFAASGGMSETVGREMLESLQSLWAIEQAMFASLREACEPSIRPVVDRAEALRAERFWVGETSVFGPRFETLDLETTIRGCASLAGPLDPAARESLDRLLADYRQERMRLLAMLRRASLSTAADANRVAIEAQTWALAKQRAGEEERLDPQVLMGLAMAAQLLPTMEAWQQFGAVQGRAAESAATILGPVQGWCIFAAIWDAHPHQPFDGAEEEPAGARVAAWIAGRQQAGDLEALARAEAWLASDAAAVAAWMREILQENKRASLEIRRAVSVQPIDFDALAALVAEAERNPPTHMRLADERRRSVERLVGGS
jgi:hypothetical protein